MKMNKTRLLEKISIQSGISADECSAVLKTFERVLSEELTMDRRVELVFPIDDQDLKERAFGILELMLSDTVNARIQQPDTTYAHIDKRGKAVINSQTEFARLAREALEAKQVVDEKKPYVPKKAPTFDQRELED